MNLLVLVFIITNVPLIKAEHSMADHIHTEDMEMGMSPEDDHGAMMQAWEQYTLPIAVIALAVTVYSVWKHYKNNSMVNKFPDMVGDKITTFEQLLTYLEIKTTSEDTKDLLKEVDLWVKAGNQIPEIKLSSVQTLLQEIRKTSQEIENSLLWTAAFEKVSE
jgi:hypothetical protein